MQDARRAELGKKQGMCVGLFCLKKKDINAKSLACCWAAQVVFPRKLESRS